MQIKGRVFGTEESVITAENGVITDIGKKASADALDFGDNIILPGFIDVHTHGALGMDTMDASDEAMLAMKKHMAQNGVTAFLPTTVTMPTENLRAAVCAAARNKKGNGAEILGVHLEGPYFSPEYKGAQNPAYLRDPDIADIDLILDAEKDFVRIVSLAPERSGAEEMIRHLKSRGVTVAAGHTAADYDTVKKAVICGVTEGTHLYNCMTPFAHRAPGVVGAILDSPEVFAELICDGVHVHPASARVAIKAKGADRVILISDSMRAAGMPDGEYELGGQKVIVRGKEARIENGALAGGISNVTACFRNVISWGIPFDDAVRMASENPAKSIGATKKGKLCRGFDADMIVLNEKLELLCCVIGGEVYDRA